MVYHFKVHREKDGFWAECLELEGCSTEAASREELRKNAEEALNLYPDEPEYSQITCPLPQRSEGKEVIEVPVDPRLALSMLLRNHRIRKKYTQKEVAEKLGMKNLYSYQRLERKSNPSLETLRKLKEIFPDPSVDYVLQT